MDIDRYLHRIKYKGSLEPNLKTLKRLQKAHLLSVPFENLDVHSKTPISLDVNHIYEKIITNKRGGFCYELNSLFHELLRALGYDVKIISARVYNEQTGYSNDFDHLSIIVTIDNIDYLTDVGFGEFLFEPMELKINNVLNDTRNSYFIDTYNDEYWRINKLSNKKPMPKFIFKNKRRSIEEFKAMCAYHQSNPASNFVQKRLVSLATENGRITLTGNTLKITGNNKIIEKREINEKDIPKVLWKNFKILL